MPCTLPLGDSRLVLKSACASSHSTRSFLPCSRQWRATALIEPMASEWSPPSSTGSRPSLQLAVHALVHQLVPAHHLGQVAVALHGRLPGIGRSVEVAEVVHLQVAAAQRARDAGHAQRLRSHGGAAVGRADVGGRADQGCGARRPHASTPRRAATACGAAPPAARTGPSGHPGPAPGRPGPAGRAPPDGCAADSAARRSPPAQSPPSRKWSPRRRGARPGAAPLSTRVSSVTAKAAGICWISPSMRDCGSNSTTTRASARSRMRAVQARSCPGSPRRRRSGARPGRSSRE